MDSLSSLSTFVQAAETRSFTQAGRMLGVSSSAIGKTIARLEAQLDVRLFTVALAAFRLLQRERCCWLAADASC